MSNVISVYVSASSLSAAVIFSSITAISLRVFAAPAESATKLSSSVVSTGGFVIFEASYFGASESVASSSSDSIIAFVVLSVAFETSMSVTTVANTDVVRNTSASKTEITGFKIPVRKGLGAAGGAGGTQPLLN